MKKTLRLLFVAFVVVAMFALTMTTAMAAEPIVIDDATNAEAAFNEAIEAAKTSDVTVTLNADWVLDSDVTIGDPASIPENKITVNGTGSIDVSSKVLALCGNFEFTGVTLKGDNKDDRNVFFAPDGASITVKNITAVSSDAARANIAGSNIHISDGTFFVVAGNINHSGFSINGANITVLGGTIGRIVGGSYAYNVANGENGDAMMGASTVVVGNSSTKTGPTVTEVVGGSWYAASTFKGATLNVYGGTIKDLIACGAGYTSAAAKELNALYTVNWNGGTVSGRWCSAIVNGDTPDDKSMWLNAVININTTTNTTGFAGVARRSSDTTARKIHTEGNVTINVATGISVKNIYNGSYLEGGGSSNIDVTVRIKKGATLAGNIYCASNIGSANCTVAGDTDIIIGDGEGTAKTVVKGELYLGSYFGGKATGSTLGGKTTLVANYIDLKTNKKTLYAGSNNQAAAKDGVAGVTDTREIECTFNNSELYTVYAGSNLAAAYAEQKADVTINVSKGSTLGGDFYGSANVAAATCKVSGNTTITLGSGEGTTKTTVNGNVYLGARIANNSKGSTVEGKTTFTANYIDLKTSGKTLYAGSNNQAAENSGNAGVEDNRTIDCALNNSEFKRVYLGSYLGNITNSDGTTTAVKAAKRIAKADVVIDNCTFSEHLVCGSHLNGQYAKDYGSLVATIKNSQVTSRFIGGCLFSQAFVEQGGTRRINLNTVEVAGEFYGAGVYVVANSTSSRSAKRFGTTTLDIKNVTTKNAVTLFGSKVDTNYFTDEGTINVVVDGFTTSATNIYCAGYNNKNADDCANKFNVNMTVELKKIEQGDTFWIGIGGYNKGSLTEGESANRVSRTLIVDKQSTTVMNNASIIKIASKSSKFYTNDEYVIKNNGVAYARTTNKYATLQAAINAVDAKNITVSENDFSIVGTSIRISNLAMRCRVKVSKNNSLDIKRMGVLVGRDNSKLYEFDIYTNLPSSNNVKDANAANATNGLVENDKDYPNHNLFAAAVTGYEDKGVLDTTRATTNIYFRAYIIVEEDGIQKIVYTVPSDTETGSNYGKSFAQTAYQLKNGVWYNGLSDEKKSKVDEIAKLFKA